MRRCAAITRAGVRCNARAMNGSEHCNMHDPARADERRRRSVKGGKTTAEHRARKDEEAARQAVSEVRAGLLEPDVARAMFTGLRTVAVLIELQRKLKETDELEARIEAIERRQEGRQANAKAKPYGTRGRWG
jgi:hypothetical protein